MPLTATARRADTPSVDVRIVRLPHKPLTVYVEGELDLLTRPLVEKALEPFILRGEPVLLDLSDVTFADTTTVQMLLVLEKTARERGWEFAVVPSEPMRFVLRVCQAEKLVTLAA